MSFLDAETDDDTSIASDASDANFQNGRVLIDDEAEESDNDYSADGQNGRVLIDDEAEESDNDYSADGQNGRVLIDDEAEESDNDYSSDVSDSLDGAHAAHLAFPQFMQLPPELRHRIWQFYCPDLTAKARVLQFTLSPSSAIMERPDHHSVKDHPSLADQTEKLRAMLSTHRESRSIVVQKFPEELGMDAGSGDAIVRFRKETDVIILQGLKAGKDYFLPDFSKEIQNIAVNPWELFFGGMLNGPVDEAIPAMKGIFRNLRRLYVHTPAESQTAGQIRWCVTDYVHAYMVETYEKEPGLGEDTQSLFCWPDVDGHPDFAKYSIPKLFSRGKDVEVGVEMWPMVEFELEEGISQYNVLRLLKDVPDLGDDDGSGDSEVEYGDRHDDDDDDSEEGTDWDVYESEGIDDDEILESGGSSEDEVVPGDAGRFSSPESDHVQIVGEGEGDACAPVQRSRKRKAIVVDSDDYDEEEDGEPRTKRARQPRVVLDSDDDDGGRHADESEVEVVSTRRVVEPRRTVSISDDEDGEEAQENGADPESDSQEEEEDEEEDEDDVDSEDDEDEDEDGLLDTMAGEGTSDEDDEDDEGENDDGLLNTMAGEGTSDEDDEDDEGENDNGLLNTMAGEWSDDEDDEDDGW